MPADDTLAPDVPVPVITIQAGDAFAASLDSAVADLPGDAIILLAAANITGIAAAGVWDAVKLFELHPSVEVVGGRVLDPSGVVIEAGRVCIDQGAWVDPFAGRPAADPGPFALALKAHRIDRPAAGLMAVRVSLLRDLTRRRRRRQPRRSGRRVCRRLSRASYPGRVHAAPRRNQTSAGNGAAGATRGYQRTTGEGDSTRLRGSPARAAWRCGTDAVSPETKTRLRLSNDKPRPARTPSSATHTRAALCPGAAAADANYLAGDSRLVARRARRRRRIRSHTAIVPTTTQGSSAPTTVTRVAVLSTAATMNSATAYRNGPNVPPATPRALDPYSIVRADIATRVRMRGEVGFGRIDLSLDARQLPFGTQQIRQGARPCREQLLQPVAQGPLGAERRLGIDDLAGQVLGGRRLRRHASRGTNRIALHALHETLQPLRLGAERQLTVKRVQRVAITPRSLRAGTRGGPRCGTPPRVRPSRR